MTSSPSGEAPGPDPDDSAADHPEDARSALLPPEEYRARLLRPFYALLNAHPQCAVDLDVVLTQARRFYRPGTVPPPLWLVNQPHVQTLARWFAYRWHLPQDHGLADLDGALFLALSGGDPPMLAVYIRGAIGPIIGRTAEELRAAGVEPPTDSPGPWPLICPPRLDPIRYDPTSLVGRDSPAAVRRMAREYARRVEQGILDQAHAFEATAEAAGYRALPAHFRSPEQRHQAALRLYRRVIEGCTWVKIANMEAEVGRSNPEKPQGPDAVRQTATRLARDLTIPLEPVGLSTQTGILKPTT